MSRSRTTWHKAPSRTSTALLALDTGELFTFIGATQIDAWEELIKRYGGDQPTAQRKFAERLSSELDKRGTVDVLRHGVVDLGVTIKLAYFKPAHGLTPELIQRYRAEPAHRDPAAALRVRPRPRRSTSLCLSTASRWPRPS